MYRFVVFALVCCSAVLADNFACPEVKGIDNFNFKKYAQGTWYEYARYPTTEESGTCSSTVYTPDGDIVRLKDCNYVNGKQECRDAYLKMAPNAGSHAQMIYTGPYGINDAMSDGLVKIVATDYDNYSIMYYCVNLKPNERKEISWILTRSQKVSDETKAAIDNHVKESSVLDANRYNKVDTSEEACKSH